jgi:hypothetical protein
MKINFDYQLVGDDDLPIMDEGIPSQIDKILRRAVLAFDDKDKKLELFDVYMKLRSADSNTDFSLDEVTLLDRAINVYPALIYGQLHYLLTK